jgi:hypothetical protein
MSNRCDAIATSTGLKCRKNRADGEAFCHVHKEMTETRDLYCKKCVELKCGPALGPAPSPPPSFFQGAGPPPPPPAPFGPSARPAFNADLLEQLRVKRPEERLNHVTREARRDTVRGIDMDQLRTRAAQRGAFVDPLLNRPAFPSPNTVTAQELQNRRSTMYGTPMAFNDKRRGKRSKKRS